MFPQLTESRFLPGRLRQPVHAGDRQPRSPVSRLIPSNRCADICAGHTPCRMRSALLTRLDGLPSDELFAIPATRTAPVYVESSTTRESWDVASVRAGLHHDVNPTPSHHLGPARHGMNP